MQKNQHLKQAAASDADDDRFIMPLLCKELHTDRVTVFPRFLLCNGQCQKRLRVRNVTVQHRINRGTRPLRMVGLPRNFARTKVLCRVRHIRGKVQRPVEGVICLQVILKPRCGIIAYMTFLTLTQMESHYWAYVSICLSMRQRILLWTVIHIVPM